MSNLLDRAKLPNREKPGSAVRCFLAIPPNETIKEQIQQVCNHLLTQNWVKSYKWVAPANWHLTLKYLGYLQQTDLLPFSNKVAEFVEKQPAFDIQLQSVGCLPSLSKPRVLVVSIKHSVDLQNLAEELELLAQNHGVAAERRRFHPHITLARHRNKKPGGITLESAELEPLTMPVHKIVLYRSHLRADGAHYTIEAEYPLQQ